MNYKALIVLLKINPGKFEFFYAGKGLIESKFSNENLAKAMKRCIARTILCLIVVLLGGAAIRMIRPNRVTTHATNQPAIKVQKYINFIKL